MAGEFTVRNPFHTIDFHHHTMLNSANRAHWDGEIGKDFTARTAVMDAYGIDQAVLLPGNNYFGGGQVSDRDYNEFVAAYRSRHRARFPYAFGTANPLLGVEALELLRHAWSELRLDGFVWHHRMLGLHINHHSMEPLWSLARDLGAPCAVHLYAESRSEIPWRLEEVASRYPEVTFIALDAFSGADQAAWMQFIGPRYPNIVFETGAMVSVGHFLNQFLRKMDFAPRLIFGSDYYPGAVYHHPAALVEILGLDAPDAVKEGILSTTLQRLVDRTH